MKASIVHTVLVVALTSKSVAQPWGGGGYGSWAGGFPSCASSCSPQLDGSCTDTTWGDCICNNSTLIDQVNSCVSSSDCSDSDKSATYQRIASLCASTGTTITAAPEASFTGSLLTYSGPGPWTSGGPFSSGSWSDGHGPGPGGPGGPFGGNWGSWSSGPWTSGPWTAWWGGKGPGKGCPDSTWTGWTSGPWGTNAPWTSWTACTASTTATTTFTTTNTAGAMVTGTSFEVKVAEETSGALGGRSEEGRVVTLVAALVGVMMLLMAVL